MNVVVLTGRLAREPELKFTPNTGTAVCSFTLAVDKDLSKDKKKEFEENNRQTADFIFVTVYGKIAENCANYLKKGNRCGVYGRISTRSYTAEDDKKRYITEVIAGKVEFLESKKTNENNPADELPDEFIPLGEDEEIPF